MKSFLLFPALVTLITIIINLATVEALFFKLDSSLPVCFVEEISYSKEQINFQYTKMDYHLTEDQTILLTVFAPNSNKPFKTQELKEHAGLIVIQTLPIQVGPYEICLTNVFRDMLRSLTGKGNMPPPAAIQVLIDHEWRRLPIYSAKDEHPVVRQKVKSANGEDEVFSFTDEFGHQDSTLRSHDYLEKLSTKLRLIDQQIDDLSGNAKAFLLRQSHMRVTSETCFTRTWVFSIVSVILMIAVSLLQLFSLRRFFKERKIA